MSPFIFVGGTEPQGIVHESYIFNKFVRLRRWIPNPRTWTGTTESVGLDTWNNRRDSHCIPSSDMGRNSASVRGERNSRSAGISRPDSIERSCGYREIL